MNLTIKIAGEVVDIPKDIACNLKRNSPIFQRDEVTGDYAEQILLPFTIRNDRILQYFRHPQVVASPAKLYCEQYVNTNLLARGYVLPLEAIDHYQLGYTSGLADAFGILRTKSLREIDFGRINIPIDYATTLSNTYAQGGFVFPTINSPDFYQNSPQGFSGRLNDFANGSYTAGTKVPMFFVRYILDKIAEKVGYVFSYDTPEINRFLMYNTVSLDQQNIIVVQTHLPDLTVGSFLLEFAKLTNSALFFDVPNRTLQFKTRKNIYNADCTLNWSHKASPIQGKVPIRISGIQLSWGLDSDDATTKIGLPFTQPYLTPDALQDVVNIQTVWSTLTTDAGLPFSLQQGITTGQNDKKFSPRLLQWAGLYNGMPLAHAEVAGLSLDWNRNNGLFYNYYLSEEQFLLNTFKTPPIRLYLTESDLASWTPDQKVYINGVIYLFEEIECPLHDLSMGCIATGYRIG